MFFSAPQAQYADADADDMDFDSLTAEERADLEKIRLRKQQIVAEHRIKKSSHNNNSVITAKHRAVRENTAEKMQVCVGAARLRMTTTECGYV